MLDFTLPNNVHFPTELLQKGDSLYIALLIRDAFVIQYSNRDCGRRVILQACSGC